MIGAGNLTPTQIRAIERSKAFHAHIAAQAARVVPKVRRVHFIPNTPFRVPKERPQPAIPPINLAIHCRGMWFYDLIWPLRVIETPNGGPPRLETIILAVAHKFCISWSDITSTRRTNREVIPRQMAMLLCKELTGKSLPEIGRRMGGKDHTTVLHGIGRAKQLIENDEFLMTRYVALKGELSR